MRTLTAILLTTASLFTFSHPATAGCDSRLQNRIVYFDGLASRITCQFQKDTHGHRLCPAERAFLEESRSLNDMTRRLRCAVSSGSDPWELETVFSSVERQFDCLMGHAREVHACGYLRELLTAFNNVVCELRPVFRGDRGGYYREQPSRDRHYGDARRPSGHHDAIIRGIVGLLQRN